MEKKEAEHGEDEIRGILHKLEQHELVELLSTGKSGSELNSLLLEVFRRRTEAYSEILHAVYVRS